METNKKPTRGVVVATPPPHDEEKNKKQRITYTIMDEKKTIIPDFGYVNLDTGRFEELPKPKVVKCGTKNRNHAPIKVKRTIRTGVRVYQSGESIDWTKAYD